MSKKKEESLGTVTRNRAVKIFEALGFKTADKWDVTRLQKKLTKLQTLVEGADLDTKTQKRVDEILRVQNKGRNVTVVDPEDAEAGKQRDKSIKGAAKREKEQKAEKEAKADSKAKSAAKKTKIKDGSVAQVAKVVTKKKAKTTKKESVKVVKKDKRPGVIMSVLEFVKTHGPVSEKKILSLLKKRFPNRDSGSMGRSIPQIPRYLVRKKNLDVIGKNDKGQYYIKK